MLDFINRKIFVLKKRFGIINQFNKQEINELIKLHNDENFDLYSFKIFQRVRKLANGKYNLITENFYYNNLSANVANGFAKHRPILKNRLDYINMILGDFITIDITLKTISEEYDGFIIDSQ